VGRRWKRTDARGGARLHGLFPASIWATICKHLQAFATIRQKTGGATEHGPVDERDQHFIRRDVLPSWVDYEHVFHHSHRITGMAEVKENIGWGNADAAGDPQAGTPRDDADRRVTRSGSSRVVTGAREGDALDDVLIAGGGKFPSIANNMLNTVGRDG
jgi:hypothetical protein